MPDGVRDTPVDRLLDAAEALVSVGARQLCCLLSISGGCFARTATNLSQAAGLKMSEETLRRIVEAEGRAVQIAAEEECLMPAFTAADCRTQTPTGETVTRMYASCDGVMVPMTTQAEKDKRRATTLQRRKEAALRQRSAKVAANESAQDAVCASAADAPVGPPKRVRRRQRLGAMKRGSDLRYKQVYVSALYDQEQERRLVGVTRKDHKGLGQLLRRDVNRVQFWRAQERVGQIDGASHLRKRMERLRLTALALDFFHLSEHVHVGRLATFGESSESGKTWAGDVLHTVRHEGYEPFFDKLADWRGQQRGNKRKAAGVLLNYVAQRQEMIRYDEFERHGWHIGSGPIEAMCKATTRRVKGPGMRWDVENAEAMMALEALHQSNLWGRYWENALQNRN
jgi:hypothetical protein